MSKVIRLTQDAISLRKKGSKGEPYLYAKKGQKVTLVADYDNVLIVEDDKGTRFPVSTDKTDYAKDLQSDPMQ